MPGPAIDTKRPTRRGRASSAADLRRRADGSDAGLPLTPHQQLMWFGSRLYPNVPLNNMVTQVRLRRAIDAAAFAAAFRMLVARHDALRMTVVHRAGEVVARVREPYEPQLCIVDLGAEADPQAAFRRRLRATARRVFEPDEALFDAALIRLGADHWTFVINQHHCVTDGRSGQVMVEDLGRCYAYCAGLEPPPPLPSAGAGGYARYLREVRRRHAEGAAARAYWAERYAEPPPLPSFYGRPPDSKNLIVCRHRRRLPAVLAAALSRSGKPPSMVFVSVLFALLRRASGETDLTLGVPLLNRPRDHADTLGLFMETCLNRVGVDPDDTPATLFDKVRAEAGAVKPYRGETNTARGAVYEARLNYRPPADLRFAGGPVEMSRRPALALAGLDTDPAVAAAGAAGLETLDVDISYAPAAGTYDLSFTMNAGVWPDAAARERVVDHFVALVEQFLTRADEPIDALPIVGAAERDLIAAWNATDATFAGRERVLQRRFERQAARTPDALAVVCAGERWSYRELNAFANRLARRIAERGVGRGDRVGVCLPRSPRLLAALLAVLKTGAAYVPLDPAYPPPRIRLVLAQADVRLLLDQDRLGELLAAAPAGGRRAPAGDADDPAAGGAPEDLCYVIFTSGSTGRPKGVMIEQRAVTNLLDAVQRTVALRPSDRFASATSPSFDIAVTEYFLPLTTGAAVILADAATAADGRRLGAMLNAERATFFQATPAGWQLLIDAGWRPAAGAAPAGLTAGELLGEKLATRILRRCRRLWNFYGPTEATVYATVAEVPAAGYRAGDIGAPLANYRAHVLDAGRRPLPVGVIGDLYLQGPGLARGYFGSDELTGAAFVELDVGRCYRTGDLARWSGDGRIEFHGRSDQQVKLRGFRIELGDVESALLAHPGLTQAVVVAHGEGHDKRLAAYAVRARNAAAAALRGEVLAHLAATLPYYMVPASLTLLDALPTTPNGKIDRRALPAPADVGSDDGGDRHVAPRDALERQVATIWARVLGVERVGVRDTFFDLGGHSLAAMRLIVRLENETPLRPQPVDLFQGATVESMCAAAAARDPEAVDAACSAIRAGGAASPFFAVGSHPRYADAARYVDTERPFYRLDVYALQSRRLAAGLKPYTRIEDITAELVDAIRRVQPRGPYTLGGGCEGALIAFAIAARLQRGGETVERLLLWITPAPGYGRGAVFGRSAPRRMGKQLAALYRNLRVADLRPATLRQIARHAYVEYLIFRAMDRYRAGERFDGRLRFARTGERRRGDGGDPSLGWAALASGGAEVAVIPGDHATWLSEHGDAFGSLLDRWLGADGG